jgi:UDP-N-acetylglucosamine diphosphorylase / glucose-1-phosphate thymidylyltransferase / UDP-N-acetylgalactosamine diphosphorylase / glucosamine-1-phosphate N-acetyltransferase / galactosamine-1-phosphate N-acetyltransferase
MATQLKTKANCWRPSGQHRGILLRHMFRDRTVSLVIPAYNEEETIGQVVEEFRKEPHLDEIVVVDNNCKDRTAAIAAAAGARVIQEQKPGYGSALTAGMNAASGQLIVLVEADGSFRARDVVKLLCYLEDAGMVMGTRTTRQMVEQGANMRFLLRWGNVFMAKFLQLCWMRPSEPRFTDVGCTFRALTKKTWEQIRERTREPGPAFSPEMMCAALQERCRVIEVPVTYARRMGGESKHSDTFSRQAKLAIKMFRTICRKRFLERGKKIDNGETQPAS